MRKWMVTANLLATGSVVYLRADRSWAGRHEEALAADKPDIEAHLAWAITQVLVVLDPYVIEVEVDGGQVRQLSARERIRAEGADAVLARFGYGEDGHKENAALDARAAE